MVFLGGTPAALIGVVDDPRRLAPLARRLARPAQQPADLRDLPAGRRHRLPRGDRRRRDHRRRPGLLPARLRRLPARPGDQLHDDRRLRLLPRAQLLRRQGPTALIPLLPSELAAALMAVGVAFIYHRSASPAVALFGVVLVTFQYLLGAAAALPAAGRGAGAAQQAAGQLPGRDVERDAAHARPAGPDDRPALAPPSRATRGRSPSGPASRAARRSSSTSPRCCTTSASSSSPTASSRPTCRSPTRTGC